MKGKYYTTADVKEIFGWESNTTVSRKRDSGFLPAPDLARRPNKWLKVTIDSIVDGTSMASKEEESLS